MTDPTAAPAREPKTIPIPFPRAAIPKTAISDTVIRPVHEAVWRAGDYELSESEVEAVLLALEEIYGR